MIFKVPRRLSSKVSAEEPNPVHGPQLYPRHPAGVLPTRRHLLPLVLGVQRAVDAGPGAAPCRHPLPPRPLRPRPGPPRAPLPPQLLDVRGRHQTTALRRAHRHLLLPHQHAV